jgi:hypothetical protein
LATLQERHAKNPELELLLACARWPQGEADRLFISELAGRPRDWNCFVELAKHHRIVPLVSHTLHRALADSASAQAQDAIAELRLHAGLSGMQSLRLLGELQRVLTALEAAGVHARVLKGLPLAQMVFGDVSLRAPGDLDLLIDGSQVLEADLVLRTLGYSGLFRPERFSPKQLAYYRAHWKDLAYESPERGLALDLHWRCFRNPEMPGVGLCATGATETVTFGGLHIETLPRREGLLYLCVHGTLDGWVYLKALVDVAAEVSGLTERELDSLAELAQRHGVLPELTATLVLVKRWFTMDHWTSRLLPEGDRTVRHILRYVERTLESRGFTASREAIPIGETLRFEWGLRRTFRYRRELVRRILYRARMWETIRLPDWLFWAYPLLSPLEWVLFRLRQRRLNSGNV